LAVLVYGLETALVDTVHCVHENGVCEKNLLPPVCMNSQSGGKIRGPQFKDILHLVHASDFYNTLDGTTLQRAHLAL
jgi:hypothetical protein